MTNLFAENKHRLNKKFTEPKPVLVDITNVANYVQQLPDDKFHITEEMMYLPWDRCWFEYSVPKYKVVNGNKIAVLSKDVTVGIFAEITNDKKQMNFHLFSNGFLDVDESLFYIGTNERRVGQVSETSPVIPNPIWVKYMDRLNSPDPSALIASQVTGEVCNALYAILFTHCRNVTYYEKSHPEKLQKANIKRGKTPQETYRILDIEGLTKQAKSDATTERGELQTALHICRGHFKTYTEENPLFGQHTGTYWWPMHKRGSEKYGKINKDYKIKP